MRKKLFTFLLALAASVGMMNAKVTWNSSNIIDLYVFSLQSYSKEGVTLSTNAEMVQAYWDSNGLEFHANATGGFTFSNSLSKNFAKIVMTLTYPAGWDMANLGSGWLFSFEYVDEQPVFVVTWTGNAATVDLLNDESHFNGEKVESIVFYFEGDSEEPASAAPAWVRDGDTWVEDTKTLTVNSNTSDNAYASKHDIKHLIVGDAVTELGWGTFFFDSLMTTVELGNNLEIIGISAFNECRSLSTITVPASVTNIKVRAFQDCRSLTTFICEAVTPPTIGNAIFQNDNNLTAIYVPAASVDAYKSAWSDYASLIEAIGGGSAPTYTVALEDGTVNADKVTLSATSAVEGATITVTPNEEYEITAFSAYYVVVEDQLGSIYEIDATLNTETGAYSFTMPAYDVTIEATIAEKAAPAPAGNVKLIEFQVPASWENDNSPITSADFPDFVATTYEIASALPVTSEPSIVIFDFPEVDEVSVYTKLGGQVSQPSTGAIKREAFFEQQTQIHYYYTVLEGSDPTPQPVTDPITPYADPQDASVYYSTFYDSNFKYELPTGVEAYVADLSGANLLLTKIAEAGEVIPADNAVILKATVTPFTLTVSDADAVTFTATNDLQGSDTQIATPANCYVLAGTDGVVGFYHYTADNLNAHKAYVVYSGSNQAPHRLRFAFDQATGVENVQNSDIRSQKVVENGQLIIIRNGVRYNAAGQNVK